MIGAHVIERGSAGAFIGSSLPASDVAYRTSIQGCNPSARIDSKAAHYEGPIGVYDNAIHIAYTNTCNFAGLFDETFLPGIGMVQRGDTALGQFQYNLIYARVGPSVIALNDHLKTGHQ